MRSIVFTILIGAASFCAQADIYRIVRADGVVEFSDEPEKGANNVTRQLQSSGRVFAKSTKPKILSNKNNSVSAPQQTRSLSAGTALSLEQQQDIRNWERCWHLDEKHILHWICATTAMMRTDK